jgi:hypothetical protein
MPVPLGLMIQYSTFMQTIGSSGIVNKGDIRPLAFFNILFKKVTISLYQQQYLIVVILGGQSVNLT